MHGKNNKKGRELQEDSWILRLDSAFFHARRVVQGSFTIVSNSIHRLEQIWHKSDPRMDQYPKSSLYRVITKRNSKPIIISPEQTDCPSLCKGLKRPQGSHVSELFPQEDTAKVNT